MSYPHSHSHIGHGRHAEEEEDAATAEMSAALQQIGYGNFQQWFLLPITGLTLTADAMELMLLPFLTIGVECEWGSSAAGSLSDSDASWLSTSVFIGMLIGALLSGLLSDRIGRRPTVLLLTACMAIFGVWSAVAHSFLMLILCRAMVGVGVGGSPAALSLFTEFLPKEKRGEYLVHYMCFFSAGSVAQVVLAWTVMNSYGWRFLLFLSAVPAILLVVLVWLYLPESATWLLARGQRHKASLILQQAYRTNYPFLQHDLNCDMANQAASYRVAAQSSAEIDEQSRLPLIPCHCLVDERAAFGIPSIQGAADELVVSSALAVPVVSSQPRPAKPVGSFLQPIWLVFSPQLRSMSLLLCLLFFLMAFVYYGLVLMSLSFVQSQQQHDAKQGLFLCFLLIDRVGRRLTITYMFLATAAFTALIPILWLFHSCSPGTLQLPKPTLKGQPPSLTTPCPLEPLIDWIQSILLFGARASALAFNQALWIYTTELYPAEVRSSGLGLTTVFARIGGALSPWMCQWLYWHNKALAVYSCVAAACVAAYIAAKMPKDTQGQDLDVKLKRTLPINRTNIGTSRTRKQVAESNSYDVTSELDRTTTANSDFATLNLDVLKSSGSSRSNSGVSSTDEHERTAARSKYKNSLP